MDRLPLLRRKVEALLREYAGAKAALQAANKTLSAKESELEILSTQLKKAEERLLVLEIGQAIPNAESRASGRKQLDMVIAEIDKILTTLHD